MVNDVLLLYDGTVRRFTSIWFTVYTFILEESKEVHFMKQKLIAIFISLLIFCTAITPVSAAQSPELDPTFLAIAEESAQLLYELGLFYGVGDLPDGSPDFDLESKATRGQAITMLVRLLGGEEKARAAHYPHPFQDAAWASDYIGYSYEYGISYGISETEFGTNNEMDLAAFLTLVLRALGYEVVDWRNPYDLADQVGLLYVEGDCYRADIAIICLSALDCEVNGRGMLLFDVLWEQGVFDDVVSPDNPKPVVPEVPMEPDEPVDEPDPEPFGPVTEELASIVVTSEEELLDKFIDVMNGRTEKVTIKVPRGQEEACAYALNDEINRYSDCRQLTTYYYSNSGTVVIEILYDDAVSAMAYLEGKVSSLSPNAQEALEKAREVHAQLVTEGMSEYDQVKAFHDYLVNFNTYEETGDRSHSAVGALVDGKTVCEGYMEAFDLLCYLSNIECLQISGYAHSEDHGWNKVKIDGNWYNIDITWDDPVHYKPILRYDYFLVSDSKLSRTHSWEDYAFWPPAPANYSN